MASAGSDLINLLTNVAGDLETTQGVYINLKMHSVDLNEIDYPCIIGLTNTCQNTPYSASGMLLISIPVKGSKVIYHIVLRAGEGGHIAYRAKPTADGWQSWKYII